MCCIFESPAQENKFNRYFFQFTQWRGRGIHLLGYNCTDTAKYRMSAGHRLSFWRHLIFCVCVCVCVCVRVCRRTSFVLRDTQNYLVHSGYWVSPPNSAFCPETSLICLLQLWQTCRTYVHSFKWIVFIMEKDCVLCDLGSVYLRIIQTNLTFHQHLRVMVDATIRQPVTTKSRVKSRDLLLVKLPPRPWSSFVSTTSKTCHNKVTLPVPLAARSKAWVCGRSPAEIVGSNPTGSMDVCLLWVLCIVR